MAQELCFNCKGKSHKRRVCEENKNFRVEAKFLDAKAKVVPEGEQEAKMQDQKEITG